MILIGMGIAAPLAWLAVERLYWIRREPTCWPRPRLLAAALRSEAPPATELQPIFPDDPIPCRASTPG